MTEEVDHLRPDDDVGDFLCSRDVERVHFIRDEAKDFEAAGHCRTFVVRGSEAAPALRGFYALAMSRVSQQDAPEALHPNISNLPVALLGQLARDDRTPAGFGRALVHDAFSRVLRVAEQIGCVAVVLHAREDESLLEHYARLGFASFKRRRGSVTRTMWLPLWKLREARAEATRRKNPTP